MHVTHCVSSLESPSAGTTSAVTALTLAVARTGTLVELYSLGSGGGVLNADNVRDWRFGNDWQHLPLLAQIGASSAMRRALCASKADLHHTHGLWMLPNSYSAAAAQRNARPLMLSPHGMLGGAALKFSRTKKLLAWALWQGSAVRQVDCFHATCLEEYHEIRAFGLKQPVAIIPNGIDLPNALPTCEPSDVYRVVTLGRIHPKRAWTG